MYKFLILALFSLTGCAQLMHGDETIDIRMVNGKENIWSANCSGAVNNWPDCNAAASRKCPTGYAMIKKNESPIGGKRELIFQCNN